MHDVGSGLSELDWLHFKAVLVSEVLHGVCICIVNEAISAEDTDALSNDEVFWCIVLFFLQGHAWAVSEQWLFRELLSLEQHWERGLTAV